MSRTKYSKSLYYKFLEVKSLRYSAVSLSEVAPENMQLSRDSVTRWLTNAKAQPKDLWEAASKEIAVLPQEQKGILGFDDVVINKSRSQKMELVNWQYTGADKGVVKGIGVVNAIWQTSQDNYIPVDYRIWNPPDDGKTKNDHFEICFLQLKLVGLSLKWLLQTIGIVR